MTGPFVWTTIHINAHARPLKRNKKRIKNISHRAKRLLLLTDVPGVLDKEKTLIPRLKLKYAKRVAFCVFAWGCMVWCVCVCVYGFVYVCVYVWVFICVLCVYLFIYFFQFRASSPST